jgi:hypothetical protein
VKKIIAHIAWIAFLLSTTSVLAGEYTDGGYVGGRFGVNYSSASGSVSAPSKGTFAYGLQGGYLHGGYVFTSKTLVIAVGSYFDWNPVEKHANGVTYGSRSLGADAKLGLPFGAWMPYAKLGYGYSTGVKDLSAVVGNGLNAVLGLEYKVDPQWSVLGEYKADGFSSKNGTGNIRNRTVTFGFNYYFNAPVIEVAPVVEEVFEEEAPKPIVVPTAVTDAPPI